VRSLYNRKGVRRGGGEGHSFAFFATGAAAVLAAVFLIGFQVGRVVEKKSARSEIGAGKPGGPIVVGKENASEIRREIGAFSEEAEKLPSVPPPTAEERVRETERSLTFREALEKRDPAPAVLSPSSAAQPPSGRETAARTPRGGRIYVQAAAFRDRGAAERMRLRLESAGYPGVTIAAAAGAGTGLHRVLVGPYEGRKAAAGAMERIAAEHGVKPFLVNR
jgi:cell division septation protein DedD